MVQIPSGFRIVEANGSHATEIARNNRLCFLEAEQVELPEEVALRGVVRTLSLPNCKYILLLDSSGRIIGQYKQVWTWNDFYARDIVWMEHLYVLREFQGQGLGKLLVDHFVESTESNQGEHRPFLELLVHEGNVNAIRLYRQKGFETLKYHWMVHVEAVKEVGYTCAPSRD